MIMTDSEIYKRKEMITPFNEKQLTPNGYDVSVNKDTKLYPGEFLAVVTEETLKIPKDVVAQIWLKTKYARLGIQATFGMIDSGFEGTLALSLYNSNSYIVNIKEGNTIAQVVFIKLDREVEKSYEERSGNYQHQKEELIV